MTVLGRAIKGVTMVKKATVAVAYFDSARIWFEVDTDRLRQARKNLCPSVAVLDIDQRRRV